MYEGGMLLCTSPTALVSGRCGGNARTYGDEVERFRNDNLRAIAVPQPHPGVLHRVTENEPTSGIVAHTIRHAVGHLADVLVYY